MSRRATAPRPERRACRRVESAGRLQARKGDSVRRKVVIALATVIAALSAAAIAVATGGRTTESAHQLAQFPSAEKIVDLTCDEGTDLRAGWSRPSIRCARPVLTVHANEHKIFRPADAPVGTKVVCVTPGSRASARVQPRGRSVIVFSDGVRYSSSITLRTTRRGFVVASCR
jgi:hypothetical protein